MSAKNRTGSRGSALLGAHAAILAAAAKASNWQSAEIGGGNRSGEALVLRAGPSSATHAIKVFGKLFKLASDPLVV